MTYKTKSAIVVAIILLILIVDQWSKFWVKTNMHLGESISILGANWAFIHFVENEGMAFGLSFGGNLGKYVLTLFRIVTATVILWYIRKMLKEKVLPFGAVCALAMVCAGALGNILDSVFYGRLFSASNTVHVAKLLPEYGGYAPWLQGKVVDMFYFPIWNAHFPEWLPFIGGDNYMFFSHVFNVADSSITVGILIILFCYRRNFFSDSRESQLGQAS